jgi:hypothetical protein
MSAIGPVNQAVGGLVTQFGIHHSRLSTVEQSRFFAALRMILGWDCHPESFDAAQDKLREGSAFENNFGRI